MRIHCATLVVCLLVACEVAAQQYPGAGYPLPTNPQEDRPAVAPAQPNPYVGYNGETALPPLPPSMPMTNVPGPGPAGPMPGGPPPGAWNPNVAQQPQFPAEQPPALPPLPGSAAIVGPVLAETKPPEPPPKIWEGNFELGLDGTEGNTQNLNYHVGGKLKRKTKENTLSAEIDYHYSNSNSVETANNGLQEARAEHNFGDSPWTCFLHDTVQYDEFKEYHLRVSADAGVGYQFIKIDTTSIIGRFGAGTSRQFAGPDEPNFVPELVFGLEAEHKLSKWQKLTSSVEYRPDITDFTSYHVTSKAGWEVLLDEDKHLSLKLGLRDLYDSNSGTKKPNDLDYNAALLWSF
jgi:putative salt-induced outer membrane protein YdiY